MGGWTVRKRRESTEREDSGLVFSFVSEALGICSFDSKRRGASEIRYVEGRNIRGVVGEDHGDQSGIEDLTPEIPKRTTKSRHNSKTLAGASELGAGTVVDSLPRTVEI